MQIGRYQLLRKIASGGMAEIYLARQQGVEGFQKNVVVKRILPTHADNDELIQMFLDEARIASSLTHPNVVQIYELGQHDHDYFIAMEYVHGMDLRHICERGLAVGNFIPLRHAVRIIADSAAGLHYAHTKTDDAGTPLHIVHRDISPQNILVSFNGTAKVLDFGIAKAANKVTTTRTGQIKGKFAYMSPEQCSGAPIDHRSDLFALGTILYEITVCRRLFKADTDIQTIQRVSEAVVTPPSQLQPNYPRDLEAIVLKALQRRPEDRFRSARELQLALEDFLTDNRMKTGPIQIAEYMKDIFPDKLDVPAEDPALTGQTPTPTPQRPPGPPGGPPRPGKRPPGPPAHGAPPPRPPQPGEAVSFVANPNAPYEVSQNADFKKKGRKQVKKSSVKRVEHTLRSEEDGEMEVYEKGSRIYYFIIGAAVLLMLGYAGYLIVSRGQLFASPDLLANTDTRTPLPEANLGEPPPPLKTLQASITSEPSGASVVINGVLVSGQAPDSFPLVPGSINTVSLYLDGYKPLHKNVDVPADAATLDPITLTLEPLAAPAPPEGAKPRRRGRAEEPAPAAWPTGKLTLSSVPDGADIFLDGRKVGTTPATLEGVTANLEHHITLRRSGYLDHVITHLAYANEEIKLPSANLVPEDRDLARHFVEIRVNALPKDAQIFLNDQLEGVAQVYRPQSARNQTLRVEVKTRDYQPWRRIIATTVGSFDLNPELEKIQRDPGELTLNVRPPETLIFVGSEQLEEVKKHALPSGHYTVTLVNPDGARGEVELDVDANSTAEYTIDFTGPKPKIKRTQ